MLFLPADPGLASSKLMVNTEQAYWTFSFKVRPKASFPVIKRKGRRAESHLYRCEWPGVTVRQRPVLVPSERVKKSSVSDSLVAGWRHDSVGGEFCAKNRLL